MKQKREIQQNNLKIKFYKQMTKKETKQRAKEREKKTNLKKNEVCLFFQTSNLHLIKQKHKSFF